MTAATMTEAEALEQVWDELEATVDLLGRLVQQTRKMANRLAEMQRLVYGHPHLELVRGSLDH